MRSVRKHGGKVSSPSTFMSCSNLEKRRKDLVLLKILSRLGITLSKNMNLNR